jgi:dihydropteroate synthase
MGILNVTPDSFYDGGKYTETSAAIRHAQQMLSEGADIIDIGAYSSRPNARDISEQEEIDRLAPFIRQLSGESPECIISVDTFRSKVAMEAVRSGAHIINDVSGGGLDEQMYAVAGQLQVPYILMHMRGTPSTMQSFTEYDDLAGDINQYFAERITRLRSQGVRDIILDPGPGFSKTLEQNYELVARFREFTVFGLPVLGAVSRKSMIYRTLGGGPEEALNGTTVLNAALIRNGARLLRVHDVKEAREAILLTQKIDESILYYENN